MVQIGPFQLWAADVDVQHEADHLVEKLNPLLAKQGCLACWAGEDRFGALLLHVATGGTPGARDPVYGREIPGEESP